MRRRRRRRTGTYLVARVMSVAEFVEDDLALPPAVVHTRNRQHTVSKRRRLIAHPPAVVDTDTQRPFHMSTNSTHTRCTHRVTDTQREQWRQIRAVRT